MEHAVISLVKNRFSKSLALLLTLIYVLSPIDIIPDVPPIGWLDDLVIITLVLLYVSQGKEGAFKNLLGTLKWLVVMGMMLLVFLSVLCLVLIAWLIKTI